MAAVLADIGCHSQCGGGRQSTVSRDRHVPGNRALVVYSFRRRCNLDGFGYSSPPNHLSYSQGVCWLGRGEIRREGAPPLNENKGAYTCRIPDSGLLNTSSALETGWAKDEYFYYSEDGSVQPLKETGWGAGGTIWAGSTESEQMADGSKPTRVAEYFYVGIEEQYHHAVAANEGRPFNEAKREKPGP